jgi:hypothetical protein
VIVRDSVSIDLALPFPCPGAPGGVAQRITLFPPTGQDALDRFRVCWQLRGVDGFWTYVVQSLVNPEQQLCFAETVDAKGNPMRFAMRAPMWDAIHRMSGGVACQKITSEFAALL